MRNIKLTIEYDGTNFSGWQIQRGLDKKSNKYIRTVQDEIRKVLIRICKEEVNLIGSGRTDAGVHAFGQIANFKTNSTIELDKLLRALNGTLPEDISVANVEEVNEKFHAQYSIKEKTYRYLILNSTTRSALHRQATLFYPYKLNITRMKEEAKALIGRKDFRSFQALNQSNKDKETIRTVKNISIQKKGPLITIDITANGFLYKMARNIVGVLLAIGSGKLEKGSTQKILRKKNRLNAMIPAKAHGLYLLKTSY